MVYHRGQYWVRSSSASSLMVWAMGQSVPSASLQMTPTWEEQLMRQRVVLPSTGTSSGWGHGLTGTSSSSTRGSVQSPAGGEEQLLVPVPGGGHVGGQHFCRKGPVVVLVGHQVEHEAAMCPCHKERLNGTLGCLRSSVTRRLREVIEAVGTN